ncbi:alpha-(1,3)-fucosyltransferase 10 [Plakobranchus ocellatus]|uniref:Alpha-(1,3)-fucosyltransferase 10 n=1 Tax=Plakobranchus ocellatus TaxID=259542 RepID=A0AAV3ZK53_9GAST|nr:alpha-(1,3)-fucosyltransferase 10 [Plakobranchus ocellatus]
MDYDKLRNWKHTGVTNSELQKILKERTWTPYDEQTWSWGQVNFVEAFECFVCEHIHENLQREARGDPIISRWAKKEHYGCPMPFEFDESGRYTQESKSYTWSKLWQNQLSIAENLIECVTQRLPYCGDY